jgi:hypothetical protein
MQPLKRIRLKITQLVKLVLWLPQTISLALKERRQQAVRNDLEVERLDRIRNPSKYLGK